MKASLLLSQTLDARRKAYILGSVAACVIAVGIFAQDQVAYFCIALPAILPLATWLRAGAAGMPVLPALSVAFFIYYAMPLLRREITAYGPNELFWSAVMVGTFLTAASLACRPFLIGARRPAPNASENVVADRQIVRLVYIGLFGGIVYHLAVSAGYLSWAGSSLGLIRSLVLTLSSVSCYLLGSARASRLLVGGRWGLAAGGLCTLILLSFGNLLLVGGIMNGVAAILGYVITSKRVPWIGLGLAFALLSVLHAGKFEMRKAYWLPRTQTLQQISVLALPGMMVEWVTSGVETLAKGGGESDVFERASLLHMLLLVQRATPAYIPHLQGETYALLPSLLVPRFFDPGKPESQAGLNLLSLRYGLQVAGASASTTIGWGLIAEAYANFGYPAVVLVGALFGAFCGGLTRLTIGAAPLSLPMFVTIAATLCLFNLELDLSYLVATLAQSIGAILVLAVLPGALGRRRRKPLVDRAPLETPGSPLGEAPSP